MLVAEEYIHEIFGSSLLQHIGVRRTQRNPLVLFLMMMQHKNLARHSTRCAFFDSFSLKLPNVCAAQIVSICAQVGNLDTRWVALSGHMPLASATTNVELNLPCHSSRTRRSGGRSTDSFHSRVVASKIAHH